MDAYVNKVVQIITNDGRVIVGVLKGFDQTTNVILEECHERVFSTDAGVEQVVLGLYIVRGDNMCADAHHAPCFGRGIAPTTHARVARRFAAPSWARSMRRRTRSSRSTRL